MKSILVFCGSKEGYNEVYRETAYELGKVLAMQNMRLVYGGAKVGLMGAVADGALHNGGKVTGVIPHFLKTKEVAHDGLTELITVDSMHERKLKMYELCDGVITLPGAWGSMDELFEMLTWAQLGLGTVPVGVLNINGFYDALIAQTDTMVQEGFLNEYVNQLMLTSTTISDLMEQMEAYVAPESPAWLTRQTI